MTYITFIHTSKNIKGNPNTLLLPIGLISIANFLKKHGIESEVIHFELEKAINPKFNLIYYLISNDSHIICLDLHWHYNSYKVIQIVKEIKKKMPTSHIILGGFTASFFAEEILKENEEVDFVIRGDSEIPLLNLINNLKEGTGLNSVPNLVWRLDGKIIKNPHTYVISQEIIDGLDFSNFELLKNNQKYNRFRLNNDKCLNCNKACKKMFYYNCGRGCPVNCSFCGGSKVSQNIINSRENVIMMNHDSVIRELKNAVKNDFYLWYTCFDPFPEGDYYTNLFKKIRNTDLNLALQFECWSLPTKNFVDEFENTFDPKKSRIIISPETGSDSVRKKNKGYFYSNKELINRVRYIYSKNIGLELYFTVGLSGEKKENIYKTLTLINFLRRHFKNIKISCMGVECEPASPWFLNKEKYGIVSKRKNFKDFLNVHKIKSDIGYATTNLSKKEINSALDLIIAESNCTRNSSFFLNTLLSSPSKLKYFSLARLYKLCKKCERFSICFRK